LRESCRSEDRSRRTQAGDQHVGVVGGLSAEAGSW
jgi:hypothetical protein